MQPACDSPQLIRNVLEIADEAGAAILKIYRDLARGGVEDGIRLADKTDASPVTKADLAAHKIICERLYKLTPKIRVISEESSDQDRQDLGSGAFWLVDPLDGTKEFLARNDDYTVNIALVKDGIASFGVVAAPALDLMYWGTRELGAYRRQGANETKIHVNVRPVNHQAPLRVAVSKSHMNADTARFLESLGTCELLHIGSSLKLCKIADGTMDCYPRLGPTCEWDIAAAHAVVEAAGGYVTTLDGNQLRYGKPEVLNPYFVASAVPLRSLIPSDLRARAG
jgi:3'(2'), 5'-bisphosphate nucleotidase